MPSRVDVYPPQAATSQYYVVCTSSTRPAAPLVGQTIFETDTGRLLVWKGAAWKLVTPEMDGVTFTTQTGPSAGNSMTLGTLTMSKSYVGLPVVVRGVANGWVLDTVSTGPVDHTVWLEVSTNGGSSWIAAPGIVDTTNASIAKFRGTWAVQLMQAATPTGTVQVRLRCSQAGGSVPAKAFYDNVLIVEVLGT